ncbi:MAG: DNA-directed RNA polymerase subunit omega [Ruminococcus sp.]|jgi:DNA-directed RNA polymerase subunit omega|nr:DNA-directed RNA polymerase subunit omega [Ruminococcus sp.]MDR0986997.1 DNA-directed RNA polymerase subunit omega [Ruminococcus sp.]
MENNMLRPSIQEITTQNENPYTVVIGVAKRAREIADDVFESGQILEHKPVKTAVEDFAKRRYRMIEDPTLRGTKIES